jgi:hypothetical protein
VRDPSKIPRSLVCPLEELLQGGGFRKQKGSAGWTNKVARTSSVSHHTAALRGQASATTTFRLGTFLKCSRPAVVLLPPQTVHSREKEEMAANFAANLDKAQKWGAIVTFLQDGVALTNANKQSVQTDCAVGSPAPHKAELEGILFGLPPALEKFAPWRNCYKAAVFVSRRARQDGRTR